MNEPNAPGAKAFNFPIPIDPLRLFYGIRKCWIWFLVLPGMLGALGWIFGSTKTENRYSVSLQLIESEVPTTIQTSESGQAFKPRELSDDTLLATTYSTEVLSRTANRIGDAYTPGRVKSMVEIAKQRNTALYYLTAHSRVSAEDAITVVTTWAEEIIRFTNNLQKEEARNMGAFISEQLASIDNQMQQVNRQILDFAKTNQFVDVEQQTISALSSLENTRTTLADTRIELETTQLQIERYMNELRDQSPYEADLKRKREELTFLRGRYTDENPLVIEKLYEIEYINEQLNAVVDAQIEDLKDYTGSDLGNNIYLEIIALQNQEIQLEKLVVDLEERLAVKEAAIADLPEKSLRLSELRARRDLLIDARALLESRKKETSFYATSAPGYWQIFQEPSMGDVSHSSQNVKALLLGTLGTGGGFFIAFCLAIFWEAMQSGLRTPLEAAIVTSSLPILNFVTTEAKKRSIWNRLLFRQMESENNERALRTFWLTRAVLPNGKEVKKFLFVPTGVSDEEDRFWTALLDLIHADGYTATIASIGESTETFADAIRSHPGVHSYVTRFEDLPTEEDRLILLRLNQVPSLHDICHLKAYGNYYVLISPSIATRTETKHRSELLQKILGPSQGLILIDQSDKNTLPRALKWLEINGLAFLARGRDEKKAEAS